MTLSELFRGVWTWSGFAREVLPIVVACAASFWAGYERGERIAYEKCESHLAALTRRQE